MYRRSEDLFPDTRQLGESPLKSAQIIMLRILKYLDHICEGHGLRYSLTGGTLLGAIRHQGFIPWDDDMDILMPRPDYERFIEIAPALLPMSLQTHTRQNDAQHFWSWMKIRDNNSEIIEIDAPNYQGSHGIFVDIYPLDVFYPLHLQLDGVQRKFNWLRRKSQQWGVPWLGYCSPLAAGLISYIKNRLYVRDLDGFNAATSKLYFNPYCRYQDEQKRRIVLDKDDLLPLKKVPFEEIDACVIQHAEKYLEILYGPNYMTPPPPKQQKTHASFIRT